MRENLQRYLSTEISRSLGSDQNREAIGACSGVEASFDPIACGCVTKVVFWILMRSQLYTLRSITSNERRLIILILQLLQGTNHHETVDIFAAHHYSGQRSFHARIIHGILLDQWLGSARRRKSPRFSSRPGSFWHCSFLARVVQNTGKCPSFRSLLIKSSACNDELDLPQDLIVVDFIILQIFKELKFTWKGSKKSLNSNPSISKRNCDKQITIWCNWQGRQNNGKRFFWHVFV